MTYKGRFTYLSGTAGHQDRNAALSFALNGGLGLLRLKPAGKADESAHRQPPLKQSFAK